MDNVREEKQPTSEAPQVERAPGTPQAPETSTELDAVGSAWEAFMDRSTGEAKAGAESNLTRAAERLGVPTEAAQQAAIESGVAAESAAAATALTETTRAAKRDIAAEAHPIEKEQVRKTPQEMRAQMVIEIDNMLEQMQNPDLKQKLRDEINRDFKDGKFSLLRNNEIFNPSTIALDDEVFNLNRQIRELEQKPVKNRFDKDRLDQLKARHAELWDKKLADPLIQHDMQLLAQVKAMVVMVERKIQDAAPKDPELNRILTERNLPNDWLKYDNGRLRE